MKSPLTFKFILGNAVTLDCSVELRFGRIEAHTLKAFVDKKPFMFSGIMVDDGKDIVLLSEVLVHAAEQELSWR